MAMREHQAALSNTPTLEHEVNVNTTESITVTINYTPPDIPALFEVSLEVAIEMLHIIGMGMWEATAPPPGTHGSKGGVWMENSQQARLQFLLQAMGTHDPDRVYRVLERRTHYSRTDTSSVMKVRPNQSLLLNNNWYLDTCLSLPQKLEIVEALKYLGYSRNFVETAKRFVAGEPIAMAESGPGLNFASPSVAEQHSETIF
jgi:hypothetical protein